MFNDIINIKFCCLYIFILILHFVPGLLHCVWFKVVIMKVFIVFCKELNHQDSTRSSSENRQISRLWKRFNDPHLSFVLAPSSGRKNYYSSKGGSQLMEHENSIVIKKHNFHSALCVQSQTRTHRGVPLRRTKLWLYDDGTTVLVLVLVLLNCEGHMLSCSYEDVLQLQTSVKISC